MKLKQKKLFFLFVLIALIIVFFTFDLNNILTLENLKANHLKLYDYYLANQGLFILFYFLLYIVITAISLPGATILTLAAGTIFGFWLGTLIVSFASTIGASLAFLVSRFLFKEYIEKKFQEQLQTINSGIKTDGALYLFSLRLIPIFPFFIINLIMGVTKIRLTMFYIISQIGMLPGTMAYVNAGNELGKINNINHILSQSLIFSFMLIATLPILFKKLLIFIRKKQVLKKYKKPKKFDYNLAVIGAGSAGLVAAYIANTLKAKVAIIEKNKMGGDCLNAGCIPSKTLIRSARINNYLKTAEQYGLKNIEIDVNLDSIMKRINKVVQTIEPHDSIERYTKLGAHCIKGKAKIIDPYTIEVNGRKITCQKIIIASGAKPRIPNIPGLEKINYYTSDTIWNLKNDIKKLLILGGGAIGLEIAQSFARLGRQIIIVERAHNILLREDDEISEMIKNKLKKEGLDILVKHNIERFEIENNKRYLICTNNGKEIKIEFDEVFLALGRKANTANLGLEELNIKLSPNGTISVNKYLETSIPGIYACGDVAGPYQFTHTASLQAWHATINALLAPFKKFKVDYRVIPWSTYTDPEVARVGINEKEAKAKKINFEVTKYNFAELDRAIVDNSCEGLVKIITQKGKDKILGVTIVGSHAGDLLTEYILAMKYKLGLNKVLKTTHIYPTLAEANKAAAGVWKRKHIPKKLLSYAKKYFARKIIEEN